VVRFGETGSLGRPQTILLMEDEAFVRKATASIYFLLMS